MNLRSLDLNLLVLLSALLEEGHVTRAARRAGLTQPAMSNALERCRNLLGDRLLERRGGAMRLTARAEAMREPLADLLRDVTLLIDPVGPPLDRVRQTVRIVGADALASVLAPPLLAAVGDRAPGVTLAFLRWGGGAAALSQLAEGSADLAISVLPPADPRLFLSELIREERYLLAMRADHPLADHLDASGWLDHPHILVSVDGATRTLVDDMLAGAGLERRVGVSVPSFLLVPELLRGSDMVALVPSLCVADARGAGLALRQPPVDISGFRLEMAHHRRSVGDPAIEFILAEVRQVFDAIPTARLPVANR